MQHVSVPDEKGEVKITDAVDPTDPKEQYFAKLRTDRDFQEYVIGELFDLSDYANIMGMKSGKDMETLGKELLIRQEVVMEIKKRIQVLVQDDESMV